MADGEGPIHFLNVEYFFRLIYEALLRGHIESGATINVNAIQFGPILSAVWNVVTILGFVVSLLALMVLVFATVRIYQIRRAEEHLYEDIEFEEADRQVDRSRWQHVVSLVESPHEKDWRQAVIEADIMLDEILTEQHYEGNTVADKLAKVDPVRFKTLNEACEAHNVRNQMAAAPEVSLRDEVAYRAIKHYEAVFREFDTIDT